jgi:hypothetical protein
LRVILVCLICMLRPLGDHLQMVELGLGRITWIFFQTLFLMMVLQCFNLSPEVVEKKGFGDRAGGGGLDLFRKVLWSNSHLCYLEIVSSVHSLAAAAQSTGKHFMDTPAVQFGRVGVTTVVTQLSKDS